MVIGHDYNNLVMIRQAIALGVLESGKREFDTKKKKCIDALQDVLCQILPKTKNKDVNNPVIKFVESALTLKNAMTEEQAVYRCFMPHNGESVDEASFQMSDEERVSGAVLLCTFPGLSLINKDNLKKLMVVKADGELENQSDETMPTN